MDDVDDSSPLQGVRFLELGGIGPVPHAGMLLADLGAQGVRLERPGGPALSPDPATDPMLRGREIRTVDLRQPDGRQEALELVSNCDLLLEGFRPGVAERLGLGPADCWARNRRLVYGRMTGWGQSGPWAQRPGHDINYSGLAGPLRHTARSGERPVPATNVIADHGGGSAYLVIGLLAALWRTAATGQGMIVDAAMVDGAANLMSLVHSLHVQGAWENPPGDNLLDGGCPFYDVYCCADGGFMAVGALEPVFFAELLAGLGLADDPTLPAQYDRAGWPQLRARFAQEFAQLTRAQWEDIFQDRQACVTPVLSLQEAPRHPHLAARGTFVVDSRSGMPVPGPAPRFAPGPG